MNTHSLSAKIRRLLNRLGGEPVDALKSETLEFKS